MCTVAELDLTRRSCVFSGGAYIHIWLELCVEWQSLYIGGAVCLVAELIYIGGAVCMYSGRDYIYRWSCVYSGRAVL